MIDSVLNFLRDRLNKVLPRDPSGGPAEDLFVFPAAGKDDTISFKADAVTLLLLRIEEDETLRHPELYARVSPMGTAQKISPEIRIHLYVMFIAKSGDNYAQALGNLSRVIRYFQNHRVFSPGNSPDLPENLSQVILELMTPSFTEQNEIWGSLRTAYHPNALYKIKLIVFQDAEGTDMPVIKEVLQKVTRMPST